MLWYISVYYVWSAIVLKFLEGFYLFSPPPLQSNSEMLHAKLSTRTQEINSLRSDNEQFQVINVVNCSTIRVITLE